MYYLLNPSFKTLLTNLTLATVDLSHFSDKLLLLKGIVYPQMCPPKILSLIIHGNQRFTVYFNILNIWIHFEMFIPCHFICIFKSFGCRGANKSSHTRSEHIVETLGRVLLIYTNIICSNHFCLYSWLHFWLCRNVQSPQFLLEISTFKKLFAMSHFITVHEHIENHAPLPILFLERRSLEKGQILELSLFKKVRFTAGLKAKLHIWKYYQFFSQSKNT